jgi:hypothetical protein
MTTLGREKPSRLEGILVEHLFFRDILSHTFGEISTGWWFSKPERSSKLIVRKFVHAPDSLSSADFLVAKKFGSNEMIKAVMLVSPSKNGFFAQGWCCHQPQGISHLICFHLFHLVCVEGSSTLLNMNL